MAVSEEESSSAKSRPASNVVHYLSKCVLRGSVVLQVVQGHIRPPSSNDVVFGKAGVPKILDGDMLAQFLELTSMLQEAVLALPLGSPDTVMFSSKSSSPVPITVNQVVRRLERVHYSLN